MSTSKHAARITEATHFEAYFDLWGLSSDWIDRINDSLHDYARPSLGDQCETYKADAAMAARFTSTDRDRTEHAKRTVLRQLDRAKAGPVEADHARYNYSPRGS